MCRYAFHVFCQKILLLSAAGQDSAAVTGDIISKPDRNALENLDQVSSFVANQFVILCRNSFLCWKFILLYLYIFD